MKRWKIRFGEKKRKRSRRRRRPLLLPLILIRISVSLSLSLSLSLMDSISSLLYFYAFLLGLNFMTCSCTSHIDRGAHEALNYHVVNVHSLFPSDVCSPSKDTDPSKLKVVHRHGPCSPFKPKTKPTHKQVLKNDQIRVDWLQSKADKASADKASSSIAASKIPARRGTQFSSANYIVTVGFGTPQVSQSVVFDTGSDVTWIQCKPCVAVCYQQQEQIFDPSKSSTYRNISCNSPYCSALDHSSCSGSTCIYLVKYGDNSYTVGFFAQDTLTLTSSDVVQNFRFGCGEKNIGLFGRTAGLVGLGRQQVSLVMQTSQKYGGVFSYCLPPTSSTPGYLTFGRSNTANVQFTPMLSNSNMPTFYFLQLVSISVGGQKLAISPTLFSNGGTIIDSGTVITRLPPTAYSALRSAFRSKMTQYPTAPASSILDTCYDFSNYSTLAIPAVALGYQRAMVNLDFTGIIYVVGAKQACLAFAPNGDDTDMIIIGNTQQRRFNVVYDLSKKMIGFGPGGC